MWLWIWADQRAGCSPDYHPVKDLLPAPDSLPPAPDTFLQRAGRDGGGTGGFGRGGGVKGRFVWTGTHRQQLQQGKVSDPPAHDAVLLELAHPASPLSLARLIAFLLFRFVPHFCFAGVSAAA